MDKIAAFQSILETSKQLVFFTGAGVSVDSDIPDFRSQDGLYNLKYDVRPEILLSHSYFFNHPEKFYCFYRDKMIYPHAKPNITHHFIAAMEKAQKSLGVITQNIDGLHQAAGSKNVIELHGSVHRNTCTHCGKHYGLKEILALEGVPKCTCGGVIKPDVVLYEEPLSDHDLDLALKWIQSADCLVICGTSLSVYPAASLVQYFCGNKLIVINKSTTYMDQKADLVFNTGLKEILSKIKIKEIL